LYSKPKACVDRLIITTFKWTLKIQFLIGSCLLLKCIAV